MFLNCCGVSRLWGLNYNRSAWLKIWSKHEILVLSSCLFLVFSFVKRIEFSTEFLHVWPALTSWISTDTRKNAALRNHEWSCLTNLLLSTESFSLQSCSQLLCTKELFTGQSSLVSLKLAVSPVLHIASAILNLYSTFIRTDFWRDHEKRCQQFLTEV